MGLSENMVSICVPLNFIAILEFIQFSNQRGPASRPKAAFPTGSHSF